jgi:hypothetical protein
MEPGLVKGLLIFLDLRQKKYNIRHKIKPFADEYNWVGWTGRQRYGPLSTLFFCSSVKRSYGFKYRIHPPLF